MIIRYLSTHLYSSIFIHPFIKSSIYYLFAIYPPTHSFLNLFAHFIPFHSIPFILFGAVWRSAVQCSSAQGGSVRCGAMRCGVMRFGSMRFGFGFGFVERELCYVYYLRIGMGMKIGYDMID